MNIRTTIDGARWEGSANVKLHVDDTMLSCALKTPTQSDRNLMGMPQVNSLPGDLVVHQLSVNEDWNHDSDAIHAGILDVAEDAKTMRILAAVKARATAWSLAADRRLVDSAKRDTGANVIILPASADEDLDSFRQRRNQAISMSGGGVRVVVGISSMLKAFPDVWEFTTDAGDRFLPVEMGGYKGAVGNFNVVADSVMNEPEPPFPMGYYGERWVKGDPNRGAANLFLRRFGFQTLAHRVYGNFPPGDDMSTYWFDVNRGGYVEDAPAVVAGPEHVASASHGEVLVQPLDYRRWDETWQMNAETPVVDAHVHAGTLNTGYRPTRDLLDASLARMGA